MGINLNTNVTSLNAYNNTINSGGEEISSSKIDTQSSLEKLSSSVNINKATDDASGLSIADRLRTQSNSLTQNIQNANDSISLAQTAERALAEQTDLLQRMRELSKQSNNDTYTESQRENINTEFQMIKDSIGRISEVTEFNGEKLLDGNFEMSVKIDPNSDKNLNISIGSTATENLGTYENDKGEISSIADADLSTQEDVTQAIKTIDKALEQISTYRSGLGQFQNDAEQQMKNMTQASESKNQIKDIDFAEDSANFSKDQVLQQAGIAAFAQANANPQNVQYLLR